jgi:hypothetical protein
MPRLCRGLPDRGHPRHGGPSGWRGDARPRPLHRLLRMHRKLPHGRPRRGPVDTDGGPTARGAGAFESRRVGARRGTGDRGPETGDGGPGTGGGRSLSSLAAHPRGLHRVQRDRPGSGGDDQSDLRCGAVRGTLRGLAALRGRADRHRAGGPRDAGAAAPVLRRDGGSAARDRGRDVRDQRRRAPRRLRGGERRRGDPAGRGLRPRLPPSPLEHRPRHPARDGPADRARAGARARAAPERRPGGKPPPGRGSVRSITSPR